MGRSRDAGLPRAYWYLAASLLVAAVVGCAEPDLSSEAEPEPHADSPPDVTPEPRTVTLFLSDPEGIALDCAAVRPMTWEVAATTTEELATKAVRQVIRDVTPSPMLHPDDTRPLVEYYRGVRIDGDTVIVRFDGGSLAYLNNAACAQIAAKTPIVRTLVEVTGIETVLWEIDGEIFDAWDA
ncbi:MAG: GerMN domain-containing protein [Longimicrobiales bacterium]|nr:GerMN domain-containing protein [Longimicrobiales bacterium]